MSDCPTGPTNFDTTGIYAEFLKTDISDFPIIV